MFVFKPCAKRGCSVLFFCFIFGFVLAGVASFLSSRALQVASRGIRWCAWWQSCVSLGGLRFFCVLQTLGEILPLSDSDGGEILLTFDKNTRRHLKQVFVKTAALCMHVVRHVSSHFTNSLQAKTKQESCEFWKVMHCSITVKHCLMQNRARIPSAFRKFGT